MPDTQLTVRELRDVVERAVLQCESAEIGSLSSVAVGMARFPLGGVHVIPTTTDPRRPAGEFPELSGYGSASMAAMLSSSWSR